MTLRESFLSCTEKGIDILTIVEFHQRKFPNATDKMQAVKMYEELSEFWNASTKEEQIDEAVDVLISTIGYLYKSGANIEQAIKDKFVKVLDRDYPDEFHHTEE